MNIIQLYGHIWFCIDIRIGQQRNSETTYTDVNNRRSKIKKSHKPTNGDAKDPVRYPKLD